MLRLGDLVKRIKGNLLIILVCGLFCAYSSHSRAMDISWNGFGSAYYGQAFDKELLPDGFTAKGIDFTNFSLMGLNLGAPISDDLSFAAQLVALGKSVGTADSFGMISQWAYLNYKPWAGASFRIGRQLYPPLLASEYVRVGYLLPFRQIPNIVFNLQPFTRFDGASAYQSVHTSLGEFSFGLFGGTPLLDVNSTTAAASGFTFKLTELIGTQLTLDGDGWRVRAQASRFLSRVTLASPLPAANLTGVEHAYSIGYRYDKSNIVSWGEYIWVRTPNGTATTSGRYAEEGEAFYLLGGYRFGKFMPRYTFARASQKYNIYSNGRAITHTWGLNYQAGSQAVAKVEFELDRVPSAGGGGYFVTQPTGAGSTSGRALYAGVDFIF